MANPACVPASLLTRLRALLPAANQASLTADSEGNILEGGNRIGVMEKGRLLIEYGPLFSRIQFPPAMRAMVQATRMKVFIEVTETGSSLCAGDRIGQKKIYSQIG